MAKRRFLLDSDGSNVFWTPPQAYESAEQVVAETVGECAPEVTTYLLCSNAGTCYFPTEVGVMAPRAREFVEGLGGRDVFGMLLRGIKASGRETFVTVRMNDVHNPTAADAWNTPPIRREHPDYIVAPDEAAAGTGGWMAWCLDYTRPPVQAYFLALLRELATRYADTLDGIQLDWMRFPRHLPGATPEAIWAHRDALTAFTAAARDTLRSVAPHLQLAARVPPTLETCRGTGMDLPAWTRGKLVDFLTPCPFLTTNWTIPFAEFRRWMGDGAPPLYGGFDFNYGTAAHHPESLRGVTASLYDQGADGIYVFNFPCWHERIAASPFHWLRGLDDPAMAGETPLLVALPHARNRQTFVDGPAQVPVALAPGASVALTIDVPPSAQPARRCLALVNVLANDAAPLPRTTSPQASEAPKAGCHGCAVRSRAAGKDTAANSAAVAPSSSEHSGDDNGPAGASSANADESSSADRTTAPAAAAFPPADAPDISLRIGDSDGRLMPYRNADHTRPGPGGRSELFVEYVDRYWMTDVRPAPDTCRIFRLAPERIGSGETRVRITNRTARELTIDRVNVGLW